MENVHLIKTSMRKIVMLVLFTQFYAFSCLASKSVIMKDSLLRHVVLFSFKAGTATASIEKVEAAFNALPKQIKEIKAFEWGTNNSPENLAQGFTHCFFVSFVSEKGRETYLPHPAHLAFVEIVKPYLDKVLVVDYWAK